MKSYLLIIVAISVMFTQTVLGANIDSPLKQMTMGTAPENVMCKSGLTLILRTTGGAACVKPASVEKLINVGWGIVQKQTSAAEADLVFKNGAIYTVNENNPWAESVAITDKKITYVGGNDGADEFISENTRVIDLNGKMILPGFHDAHTHPFDMAYAIVGCNLFDLWEKQLYLRELRSCAEKLSDREFVFGVGYWLIDYDPYSLDKTSLDTIFPDKPVVFMDIDGHSYWVNSKMLEETGIDKNTPDPAGGTIIRDPDTGEPTGILLSNAMNLVPIDYWEMKPAEFKAGTDEVFAMMSSSGITSFVEAYTFEGYEESFRELDEKGDLNFRVNLSLFVDPAGDRSQIDYLTEQFSNDKYSHVRANMVKLFADNIIEFETGALLEPYLSEDGTPTDYYGELEFTQEDLNYYITEFEKVGFQIHIHAVGDKGTKVALDALEASRNTNNLSGTRNTIAHLYLIHPDDIPRFPELEVIPNYQAFWAHKAYGWYGDIKDSLGDQRAESMFPFATLRDAGARIVIGSDWPVTTYKPLKIIETAVTREDPSGGSRLLNEDERLDLETVIEAYTINGAYLMQQEDITGSIEVGKFADLVVLEENLFDIKPHNIGEVKVLMTLFEGKEIFNNDLS